MRVVLNDMEVKCSCGEILSMIKFEQIKMKMKRKGKISKTAGGYEATLKCDKCGKDYLLVEPMYLMDKREYERTKSKISA